LDSCDAAGGCVHAAKTALFTEDFSSTTSGWTLGTQWEIGATTFACLDPQLDHSPSSDNGVAGVVLGGCTGQSVHTDYCIESPPVDTSKASGSLSLKYWRDLHSDYQPWMTSKVEIWTGASWFTIWQNGNTTINDPSWVAQTFDVTLYKNPAFKVRFCYSTTQGVVSVGGWNVDDVTIYDPVCVSPL
jgi:hypothetical protein